MKLRLLDQQTDQTISIESKTSNGVTRPHPPRSRALERPGGRPDLKVSAVHSYDRDRTSQVANGSHTSESDSQDVKSIEVIQDPIESLTDFILNSVPYREEKNAEEMPTLVTEILRYKQEHRKQWNACFGQ